jgi:hypothetical protein
MASFVCAPRSPFDLFAQILKGQVKLATSTHRPPCHCIRHATCGYKEAREDLWHMGTLMPQYLNLVSGHIESIDEHYAALCWRIDCLACVFLPRTPCPVRPERKCRNRGNRFLGLPSLNAIPCCP